MDRLQELEGIHWLTNDEAIEMIMLHQKVDREKAAKLLARFERERPQSTIQVTRQ